MPPSTFRTRRVIPVALAALLAGPLAGCSFFESIGLAPSRPDPGAVKDPDARQEPEAVVVQHVLVSFDDVGIRSVTRTKDEAARVAAQVLALANAGRDFGELVRLYSDDRHGDGTYTVVNFGFRAGPDQMERDRLAPAFGKLSFSLEPGQTAVAEYDPVQSPFGWHVIRRLQ